MIRLLIVTVMLALGILASRDTAVAQDCDFTCNHRKWVYGQLISLPQQTLIYVLKRSNCNVVQNAVGSRMIEQCERSSEGFLCDATQALHREKIVAVERNEFLLPCSKR
jgi:hypothetical protein